MFIFQVDDFENAQTDTISWTWSDHDSDCEVGWCDQEAKLPVCLESGCYCLVVTQLSYARGDITWELESYSGGASYQDEVCFGGAIGWVTLSRKPAKSTGEWKC